MHLTVVEMAAVARSLRRASAVSSSPRFYGPIQHHGDKGNSPETVLGPTLQLLHGVAQQGVSLAHAVLGPHLQMLHGAAYQGDSAQQGGSLPQVPPMVQRQSSAPSSYSSLLRQ